MSKRSSEADFVRSVRQRWAALAQAAVLVSAVLGSFLAPPPAGFGPGEDRGWLNLGRFLIAVLVGIFFVLSGRFRLGRHQVPWVRAAVASLIAGILLILLYGILSNFLVCKYDDQSRIIGLNYTDQARSFMRKNPGPNRPDHLLDVFAGESEDVWTRGSILCSKMLLGVTYLLCLPFLTVSILAVIQAMSCGGDGKNAESRPTTPHVERSPR